MSTVRNAPFALRVVQRKEGRAAIVYRRRPDLMGRDRLQRVVAVSPLAFTAAIPFLRDAISKSQLPLPSRRKRKWSSEESESQNPRKTLSTGPFHPLDTDWGARVSCFTVIAKRLRDAERLALAANHMRHADADEAAWWLGLLTRDDGGRARRALRILTEAVE